MRRPHTQLTEAQAPTEGAQGRSITPPTDCRRASTAAHHHAQAPVPDPRRLRWTVSMSGGHRYGAPTPYEEQDTGTVPRSQGALLDEDGGCRADPGADGRCGAGPGSDDDGTCGVMPDGNGKCGVVPGRSDASGVPGGIEMSRAEPDPRDPAEPQAPRADDDCGEVPERQNDVERSAAPAPRSDADHGAVPPLCQADYNAVLAPCEAERPAASATSEGQRGPRPAPWRARTAEQAPDREAPPTGPRQTGQHHFPTGSEAPATTTLRRPPRSTQAMGPTTDPTAVTGERPSRSGQRPPNQRHQQPAPNRTGPEAAASSPPQHDICGQAAIQDAARAKNHPMPPIPSRPSRRAPGSTATASSTASDQTSSLCCPLEVPWEKISPYDAERATPDRHPPVCTATAPPSTSQVRSRRQRIALQSMDFCHTSAGRPPAFAARSSADSIVRSPFSLQSVRCETPRSERPKTHDCNSLKRGRPQRPSAAHEPLEALRPRSKRAHGRFTALRRTAAKSLSLRTVCTAHGAGAGERRRPGGAPGSYEGSR